MSEYVVHICTRQAWGRARREAVYCPESLALEGFIHFSRPDQVLTTANRFYAGVRGLVLLWVPLQKLSAPLKWEAADGEAFPHLYGALPVDEVAAVTDFPPDTDGRFTSLVFP